ELLAVRAPDDETGSSDRDRHERTVPRDVENYHCGISDRVASPGEAAAIGRPGQGTFECRLPLGPDLDDRLAGRHLPDGPAGGDPFPVRAPGRRLPRLVRVVPTADAPAGRDVPDAKVFPRPGRVRLVRLLGADGQPRLVGAPRPGERKGITLDLAQVFAEGEGFPTRCHVPHLQDS